jgi:hypothetical protein
MYRECSRDAKWLEQDGQELNSPPEPMETGEGKKTDGRPFIKKGLFRSWR